MCFVDFGNAFGTASHKKLWKTLEDMGFAHHLVKLIRSFFENQKSNSGVTLAALQSRGTCPASYDFRNIVAIGSAISLLIVLRNRGYKLSSPAALSGFKF